MDLRLCVLYSRGLAYEGPSTIRAVFYPRGDLPRARKSNLGRIGQSTIGPPMQRSPSSPSAASVPRRMLNPAHSSRETYLTRRACDLKTAPMQKLHYMKMPGFRSAAFLAAFTGPRVSLQHPVTVGQPLSVRTRILAARTPCSNPSSRPRAWRDVLRLEVYVTKLLLEEATSTCAWMMTPTTRTTHPTVATPAPVSIRTAAHRAAAATTSKRAMLKMQNNSGSNNNDTCSSSRRCSSDGK